MSVSTCQSCLWQAKLGLRSLLVSLHLGVGGGEKKSHTHNVCKGHVPNPEALISRIQVH